VPASEGYEVEPGQAVRFTSGIGKGDRGPSLRGTVKSAALYPASRETIARATGSEDWAEQVMRQGPVLEVVVGVAAHSLPHSDPAGLYSGAPCRANIVVAYKKPIGLVLPIFGLLTGGLPHG